MKKDCLRCRKELDIRNFNFRESGRLAGLPRSRCKQCERQSDREYRQRNPHKKQKTNPKHSQNFRRRVREAPLNLGGLPLLVLFCWLKTKKTCICHACNQDQGVENFKVGGGRGRRVCNNCRNRPAQKIRNRAHALLHAHLRARGVKKYFRTSKYLGCSFLEFRKHVESLFWPGMAWDNFKQWELDHIRPCASFDLKDPAQVAECFNFKNYQPLWKDDNRIKSKRLDWAPAESNHPLPARLTAAPVLGTI